MKQLALVDVLPMMGQVQVGDPEAGDYPQWGTGEEAAVATDQTVAVATRSDADGAVTIEVVSAVADGFSEEDVVYDGEVMTTGDVLVVGNGLAGALHAVPVGRGWHRIRIHASPSGSPSRVTVVIMDQD